MKTVSNMLVWAFICFGAIALQTPAVNGDIGDIIEKIKTCVKAKAPDCAASAYVGKKSVFPVYPNTKQGQHPCVKNSAAGEA